MQVSNKQIERQQLILKALGFFTGVVNGVWGPGTIEAKKKFEASRQFMPGIPNNGLPFRSGQRLPVGITLRHDGLLYHPDIDALLKVGTVPTDAAAKAEVEGESAGLED